MTPMTVRVLFLVAALYDGILGVLFFLAGNQVFEHFGVAPPNHIGYLQFPALLLIIFSAMFLRVAANPAENGDLMLYGCALKLAYAGLVFMHQFRDGVPFMWQPFAWADTLFFVLFAWAWYTTPRRE